MGRTKSEKKKIELSTVSDIEEREHVKESILKVFRARLTSPSEGGALLVGQEKQKDNAFQPKDSMSGRSRSKRKSTRQKKSSNRNALAEGQPETAVTKHMKVAHGIVYSHGKNKEETNIVNRIAPTRLTQKVGIFSAGKKSKPATRGLFVPDHIQQQTEAEIKKIIQDFDSSSQSTDTGNGGDSQAPLKPVDNFLPNTCVVESAPMLVDDNKTPVAKSNSFVVSSETATRSISSECPSTVFGLEPLNIKQTADELVRPLRFVKKQQFPGRDCLKETLDILHKLLKQNAPRSATPTPIPVLNKIRTSGGIQRSLFLESTQQPPSDKVKSLGLKRGTFSNTDDRSNTIPYVPVISSNLAVNHPNPAVNHPNPGVNHANQAVNHTNSVVNHPTNPHYHHNKLNHMQTDACTQNYSNKTHQQQAEPNYNKKAPCYGENRQGEHDIEYYRSRVLGTDRKDYLFTGKTGSRNKDPFHARTNQTAKHLYACLQHDGTGTDSQNRYRENNGLPTVKPADRLFETNNGDICMLPRDDFSAFFKDLNWEERQKPKYSYTEKPKPKYSYIEDQKQKYSYSEDQKQKYSYSEDQKQKYSYAEDQKQKYSYTEDHKSIPKRSLTPVEDSYVNITKPISPLLDHEALAMLHTNDHRTTKRQQFEPMECDPRAADALNLLEKNDLMQTINGERKSQEDECFCREDRYTSGIPTVGPVTVNKDQGRVMYMPGFHSDYYKDHLNVADILWQKSTLPSKTDSMDILDHVDMDSRMDIQIDIGQSSHIVRDILQVAALNSNSWRHTDTTPATQITVPAAQTSHLKPFKSPSPDSPQLFLSPRKMY